MIALIDIGNTRAKYCFVNKGNRSAVKAIDNNLLTYELLTEQLVQVTKVIIANVSHPQIADDISYWCDQNTVIYQQVVSELKKNDVTSAYQNPSQLGVDRWLALLGAASVFPKKNVLIIDAGTATTFDVLAATGQHQGGWILAGINMLISSVLANTIKVQANDNDEGSLSFGVNSSENVHHAAWAATVGAINIAVSQSEQQGIVIDEIVLTGGSATKLFSLLSLKSTVIEDLVFIGLQGYSEET